jgi:hypothetical protein
MVSLNVTVAVWREKTPAVVVVEPDIEMFDVPLNEVPPLY